MHRSMPYKPLALISQTSSMAYGYTCPVRRRLTPFCLKDSFELSSLPNNVSVSSDKMYSVDVGFLFTKVSLREIVNVFYVILSPHTAFIYPFPLSTLRTLFFYVPRMFVLILRGGHLSRLMVWPWEVFWTQPWQIFC